MVMSDGEAQVPKKEPTVYDRLAERFDAKHHKTKSIGGATLTYVDGEMVVSRLNEVLGLGGWSFEVKDIKVLEDEVWALGRITAYGPDRTIVREQAGGQIINRKRGIPAQPARAAQPADGDRPAIPAVEAQPAVKGEIIELSNDIKGAITDCLKKCATLMGVGLYLFNPDERREVEAEMREASRPKPAPRPAAPPTPIRDAAVLTGAVPAPDARAESITKLQAVMRMALAEDIEFEERNPADLTDEQIQDYGKALADMVRAARKAKAS
jgi:hypothetical protein